MKKQQGFIGKNLAVSEGAVTLTVTHNLGDANHKVTAVVPTWMTGFWWENKQPNTVDIRFSEPAPAGAQVDVVVET